MSPSIELDMGMLEMLRIDSLNVMYSVLCFKDSFTYFLNCRRYLGLLKRLFSGSFTLLSWIVMLVLFEEKCSSKVVYDYCEMEI